MWKTLPMTLKIAIGLGSLFAAAAIAYYLLTLMLIGLGIAGIGTSCEGGCSAP